MSGLKVLDVLVEKIQNSTTDDIAVLLLGYEAPMRKMLRDQNPGLARRFPVEYAFVFEDYDDNELLAIFKETCKRKQYNLSSYKVQFYLNKCRQYKLVVGFVVQFNIIQFLLKLSTLFVEIEHRM